jgi:hypothetical protein
MITHIKLSALLLALAIAAGNTHAEPSDEITEAEKQLFLNDQLSSLKAPTTLSYTFKRSGSMPEVDGGLSNPALMCFLERDIAEMERLTGGKAAYFRKRIRLALSEGPAAKPVKVSFGGKTVDAQEYRITPYSNDPNKQKFPKYVGKTYIFVLSDAVPGGIYRVDSQIPDLSKPDGKAVLIEDDMMLAGSGIKS